MVARTTCTDKTREKILEIIREWATDHRRKPVFCLTGHLGSGKTTIATTIATEFGEASASQSSTTDQPIVLGANFFASQSSPETVLPTCTLPTIAYQLAYTCSKYAYFLDRAGNLSDIIRHKIPSQLEVLIVGPWQFSRNMRPEPSRRLLIIIDALDEINNDGGHQLLEALFETIKKNNLEGIKFLITSRPTNEIDDLCKSSLAHVERLGLQDRPNGEVEKDIRKYLEDQLPGVDIEELSRRSADLFVYAATVVRFLNTGGSETTTTEKNMLLQDFLSDPNHSGPDSETTLDALYRQILLKAFKDLPQSLLPRRVRTLLTFLCTAERTTIRTAVALLDTEDKIADKVFARLRSVLYVRDGKVSWYHESFREFVFDLDHRVDVTDGSIRFQYLCDLKAHHTFLSRACFRIMKGGLKFNIGGLTSSFLFDKEQKPQISEKNSSAAFQYSCYHWMYHIPLSADTEISELCSAIFDFLQLRVLFWIEAMNIMGKCDECAPILRTAHEWVLKVRINLLRIQHLSVYTPLIYMQLKQGDNLILVEDLLEAAEFAEHFAGSPAAKSTPHLYISALPATDAGKRLAKSWRSHFRMSYTLRRGQTKLKSPVSTTSWLVYGLLDSLCGI